MGTSHNTGKTSVSPLSLCIRKVLISFDNGCFLSLSRNVHGKKINSTKFAFDQVQGNVQKAWICKEICRI